MVWGTGSPETGSRERSARAWPDPAASPTMRPVLRRLLIVTVLSLLAAGPAAAGTIVVTLNFASGKLETRAAPAVASSAGAVQVPVTVTDGRGNGKGWTLKVASRHAITVTSITARCAGNSTCTLPTALHGPSGSIVLKVAPGTGMGVMDLMITVAPLPVGSAPTPLAFAAS